MENLKIRVNSEAESKEAQELFFELGYSWPSCGKNINNLNENYLVLLRGVSINWNMKEQFIVSKAKEITLPQLRDLVVLKRNDVNDRNVTDPEPEYSANLYLDSKGDLFVFHNPTQTWKESNLNGMDSFYKVLKPITKEPAMKEYLNKLTDGTYKLVVLSDVIDGHDGLIEVPSGMNIYWKEDGDYWFTTQVMGYRGAKIIWQRPSIPEELPFIDDEPLQSLNDQYAEIEKVRQSHRTASEIADSALKHIRERAETYDQPTGERSAAKTAKAFNAITGKDITESEVWLLLQLLKDVRQWSREDYHQDSAEDCIAYASLKAESLEGGE